MPVVANPYGTPQSDRITWTNTQVYAGDLIKRDRIVILSNEVASERVRRGQSASTVTITDKPVLTEINALASFSVTANVTNPVKAADMNRIITANYDRGQVCLCNCNYCTCNCNYCTCNCNYACTCNCNYSDERLKTQIKAI